MDRIKSINISREKKIVFLAVLLSLIFNSFIYLTKLSQKTVSTLQEQSAESLKIKLISQTIRSQDKKQLVNNKIEENNIKSKKKSKFLSSKNQSYERETIARKIDRYNEGGSGGGAKAQGKKQEHPKKISKKLSLSDLSHKSKLINPKHFSKNNLKAKDLSRGSGRGVSSNNDFIEDIPLGDFTKLNTTEYRFYGFYHRIRQKLEQFWGRSIQEKAKELSRKGRFLQSGSNHVTSLKITLDGNGNIVSIKLQSTSGVTELDQAAVDSFNNAGPFPNPPKDMVQNGVVQLEWGFVVKS